MTAKEARANRYSKNDEKISYRNTFNLLVADYTLYISWAND